MKFAVIPARGGSKRIPKKNIKLFSGKPMLAWSIEAAQKSNLFSRIIVSTDDAEIAAVAKTFGAEVPFIRPDEISNEFAGTTEVVAHATLWALDQGFDIEAVCCIYATAPFVQAEDIKKGWEALKSGEWSYSFAVTDFSAPIFRSFKQTEGGGLEMFFPEYFKIRSQDLPVALHDAGQFYWGRPKAWTEGKQIFDYHSKPIFIPRWRVQDIDSNDDWKMAEFMHEVLRIQEYASE
jgi:pseudaminic acid cytidylyltransferase